MHDIAKVWTVWVANTIAYGVITIAGIQTGLIIISTLLSIAYTIHKWRYDNRK